MEDLHVENVASANIRVVEVNDTSLNQSFSGLKMSLDELNHLEKRLDTFTEDEMKLFSSMSEAFTPKDGFDLINLSYNLQCDQRKSL